MILANANSRHIPTFEQHALGADFAGHAACVPTTVAANLWWLHDTGQWFTRLGFFNEDFTVNSLGSYMNTTTSGTSGANAVNGTVDYLNHWFGYENGVHYTLEHLGGADFGASSTQVGFSPQQILQQFQAGGAVSLGLHNTPAGEAVLFPDPPFGHYVALDNVVLNPNGTAWIRIMIRTSSRRRRRPRIDGSCRFPTDNWNGRRQIRVIATRPPEGWRSTSFTSFETSCSYSLSTTPSRQQA